MPLEDLIKLSPEERVNAMEVLWRSLSNDAELHQGIVPKWHQQILASRLQQLRAGHETTVPWEQAKERLAILVQEGS
jgi:putative addiction module component (TIGR02574 family)